MLSSSIIALDVGVACHETKHQFRCCSSYLHVVVVDLQVLGPLRLVLNAPRTCLPMIFSFSRVQISQSMKSPFRFNFSFGK